jgi:hypothetical protein
MLHRRPGPAIVGDVTALVDVTIHQKGGSLTATLKKPLGERVGAEVRSISGAAVDFETGQSVVILSPQPDGSAQVHVRRVGLNRFEIAIDDGRDIEVDPVTAAFVQLQIALFAKGKLPLDEPVTADVWDATIDAKLARARAARKALRGT